MKFWNTAKDKIVGDRLLDEQMHAIAVQEIDSGVRRDGLWAKAVLIGNLDERQTKLAYLRLLVQHLKDERYVMGRVNQQREEASAAADQAERARQERDQAAQEQASARRQREAAATSAPQAHSLVEELRKRHLDFPENKELAASVGAQFEYRGLFWCTWSVTFEGTTIEFKQFDSLRP